MRGVGLSIMNVLKALVFIISKLDLFYISGQKSRIIFMESIVHRTEIKQMVSIWSVGHLNYTIKDSYKPIFPLNKGTGFTNCVVSQLP